ncbi:DUF4174 domain-containing protein [Aquicoccus sp.]|uniref:DUF4174 domain-containing protein n=1 Tax=Aquicoccus sp. TaxID=2055851 RepID=UPI003565D328
MKPVLALVLTLFIASASGAQDILPESISPPIPEDGEWDLKQFEWEKRLVIVFANSPGDPQFIEQLRLLAERPEALERRDVVVLTDTDPAKDSELRRQFRPRGFMLVLVGKDGIIYLRKPVSWAVRELTRSIDNMPLRQQEIMRDKSLRP